MYRLYLNGGDGDSIAETASADVLRHLVIEKTGAIPSRFWVNLATTGRAYAPATNPGHANLTVRLEAF